jgi:hypothetical protein
MSVSGLGWTFDVHGRDPATDPGDHGQGWFTGGIRLPMNSPGRNMNEVPGASIDVTVMALELQS